MARKAVVSGPSTRHHTSHSAKAFAVAERVGPALQVHDVDPAKELLERPRQGRPGYIESPVGRSATHRETNLAHVHGPSLKIDSPPRSPMSAKLEAERAARLPPGGKPPEEPPARATSRGDNLAFVKDDVAAGSTALAEARPRERFVPKGLLVHREPDAMGSVERSRWRVFSLTIGTRECLHEDLRECGILAEEIDEATFDFTACPAGASIQLRAKNESGHPACFQAVLFGHTEAHAALPAPDAP